jgi:hypothetical protein
MVENLGVLYLRFAMYRVKAKQVVIGHMLFRWRFVPPKAVRRTTSLLSRLWDYCIFRVSPRILSCLTEPR